MAVDQSMGVVEVLPLVVRDGRVLRCLSDDQASWQAAFDSTRHPGDVARAELERRNLTPIVVHSTSWRMEEERLVLSYVAVVADPGPGSGFGEDQVRPHDLARGTATAAPAAIQLDAVVEHAMRHLAWLARDDAAVQSALGTGWLEALRPYGPEPFSAFDVPCALSRKEGCMLRDRLPQPPARSATSGPALGAHNRPQAV